jgi:hypothetical protein
MVREMEAVIRISECTEEQKVKFASHSFVSEALCWWENIVQAMGQRPIGRMKWKQFKQLVIDQYCHASELSSLEKKFVNLEAGDLSLQEYTTKFNRMDRLLPDMVKPETRRIERFISGLPMDIKGHVISSRPTTFQSAVDLSRILYRERTEVVVVEPKRKWNGNNGKGNEERFRGNNQEERQEKKARVDVAGCKKCERNQAGKCKIGSGACFRCEEKGHLANNCQTLRYYQCDKAGHMARNCPEEKTTEPRKVKTRAYALI